MHMDQRVWLGRDAAGMGKGMARVDYEPWGYPYADDMGEQ